MAYDTLSDPDRRAEYDASYGRASDDHPPLSNTVDFMDDMEGERNRRLAVLAVLYYRRRANPYAPVASLAEVEAQMGFPPAYSPTSPPGTCSARSTSPAPITLTSPLLSRAWNSSKTDASTFPSSTKCSRTALSIFPAKKRSPEPLAPSSASGSFSRARTTSKTAAAPRHLRRIPKPKLANPTQDAPDLASAPDPNLACDMPDIFACLKPAVDDFDIDAIREKLSPASSARLRLRMLPLWSDNRLPGMYGPPPFCKRKVRMTELVCANVFGLYWSSELLA